jgi:4-amino-4-deoxy-L-arabinose transferase-like glycosyltransferase
MSPTLPTHRHPIVLWMMLMLVLVAWRLFYVTTTGYDLAPDEAQYWDWSRRLDWGYYSKGPLVAWLIAASTALLGDTPLGVRFFAVAGHGLLSLLAALTARRLGGDTAGWMAFGGIQAAPVFAAGGLMMTPDVACLVAWAGALYLLVQVDWTDRTAWRPFLAMGALIGVAGLAKFTAALFYPLLGLYLLADPVRRAWLLRPQVYGMGVVSLACLAPVFYWNVLHDFPSFRHVLGQVEGEARFAPLETVGNFLGGQAGVVSPVWFVLLLVFLVAGARRWRQASTLWWFAAPLFVFFMARAFESKVQPNWPVLMVYGGLVGLAVWAAGYRWARRTWGAGLVLAVALSVVAMNTDLLRAAGVPFPVKKDPLKEVMGWRQVGSAVGNTLRDLPPDTPVLTTRYQTAAELAFYIPGQPQVLYLNPGYRRRNQYDYWPWPADLTGRDFLYVREHIPGSDVVLEPQVVAGFTGGCTHVGEVTAFHKGFPVRAVNMHRCVGYKGLHRPLADRF